MADSLIALHTGLSKSQKYMLNSKTYHKNSTELAEKCMKMEDAGRLGDFTVMVTKHYTKFVHSWLEENWEVNDYLKEEVMKKLTASWFLAKMKKQCN